jgi:hypothetical protein
VDKRQAGAAGAAWPVLGLSFQGVTNMRVDSPSPYVPSTVIPEYLDMLDLVDHMKWNQLSGEGK